MTVEFLVLGPVEVRTDGRALPLGGPKQRALLALLLLNANGVVSRDRLIDALWGERAPATAQRSLDSYVSRLRTLLGSDRIERRPPGYRLLVSRGELDIARFEGLLEQGRAAAAAGDAATARDLLGEGLGLWRGRALADLESEPLLAVEAERLEERRLLALEARIDAELELGGVPDLVGELERLVAKHPFRERLRGQLMLALYRCGRQADALEAYQEGRRALVEELGIELSRELQELHRAILNQEAALGLTPVDRPKLVATASLPAPANRLIGRREELRALADLLLGEARLVTVTGAGGSGKTRLALEVATSLEAEFAQRVCLVLLASLREAELVPTTLLSALGLQEAAGEPPLVTLKRSLHEQALLLVLDNFEHLLGAAPLLSELLADCPRLKLLVTSRASLHLSGEHEYPLEPLPLKQAIALFTERARAVDPDFAADETVLTAICARLDCLPLALELAAARSRLLSPQELLTRLEHSLLLLTGGPRDLAARQQTLRATIDWSQALLEPDGQQLFARLTVFSGGCTLEAAERVCAASLDQLDSLVDKNLLRRRQAAGGGRFWMLETIREYAQERLEAEDGLEGARRAHADYYLALAEQLAAELEQGRRAALDALERELDNLRSAFAWTQGADADAALRLAAALSSSWYARGQLVEGLRWFEAVLSQPYRPSRELAVVAAELARLQVFIGELEPAAERVEQAFEIAEALELPDVLSEALNTKSLVLESAGRSEEALALLERALAIARDHDLGRPLLRSLGNLSHQMQRRDRQVEAREIAIEGLELSRRVGSHFMEQRFLGSLLSRHVLLGDWQAALAVAEEIEAISPTDRLGDLFGPLPWLRVQRGEVEEARRAQDNQRHLASADDVQIRAAYAVAEAVVLRAEGRPREALAAAGEALAARDTLGARHGLVKLAFVEAVEAAFALDDLDRVTELLGEWERLPPLDRTPFLEAHQARFTGRLADRRGEAGAVEPALRRATALFRQLSMPFYVAITLLEHGEWLAGQTRAADAEPLLAEARSTFEQLEAKPWLQRTAQAIRHLAVEAG